jgi:hypothetical protein
MFLPREVSHLRGRNESCAVPKQPKHAEHLVTFQSRDLSKTSPASSAITTVGNLNAEGYLTAQDVPLLLRLSEESRSE